MQTLFIKFFTPDIFVQVFYWFKKKAVGTVLDNSTAQEDQELWEDIYYLVQYSQTQLSVMCTLMCVNPNKINLLKKK